MCAPDTGEPHAVEDTYLGTTRETSPTNVTIKACYKTVRIKHLTLFKDILLSHV